MRTRKLIWLCILAQLAAFDAFAADRYTRKIFYDRVDKVIDSVVQIYAMHDRGELSDEGRAVQLRDEGTILTLWTRLCEARVEKRKGSCRKELSDLESLVERMNFPGETDAEIRGQLTGIIRETYREVYESPPPERRKWIPSDL